MIFRLFSFAGSKTHTLGGLLVIPPFLYLYIGGLLVSVFVRRYPERFSITLIVAPFEFGAFVIVATGGVSMGLSLWGGNDITLALQEWAKFLMLLVMPLQFQGAFWEGGSGYRQFIVQKKPWTL